MNYSLPPSLNPFPPMPPARKRRVVPPSSEKVAAARLRFIDAKRAAVECTDTGVEWRSTRLHAQDALDAWIAAEREERG